MPAYDAFISYSHRADRLTAPTLQKGLENFNRRWLGRRPLRIFRDQTDLSLAPSLWQVIEEALASSRFFILLASPEAAASKWVAREIEQWLTTKPKNTILLVVTEGGYQWDDLAHDFDRAASTAIPSALFGTFSEEPLFLDLRGVELHGHRKVEAQAAIATLASPIYGKSKEELLGQEIRLFRRRVTAMICAFVLIALLAAGFFWQAVNARHQRDTARTERNYAQSHLLAAQSTLALQQQQAAQAFWRAAEAWSTQPDWVAQKALYDFARTGLHATFDHGTDVSHAAMSRDGKYAATSGVDLKVWKSDGTPMFSVSSGATSGNAADVSPDGNGVLFVLVNVQVYSMAGKKQFELPEGALDGSAWYAPDSRSIIIVGDGQPIRRYDLEGKFENEYHPDGNVLCVVASEDSSKIAAGTDRGNVHLWSINGEPRGVFRERGNITSLAFSPTGSELLSITQGGKLTIRKTDDGVTQMTIPHGVLAAALSPTAGQVAVLLDQGIIRILDFRGQVLRKFEDDGNPVPPKQFAFAASTVRRRRWPGKAEGVELDFTCGGRNLVASARDITQVWDIRTGRLVKTITDNLLAASPASNSLITSGKYSALLWEVDGAASAEIKHEPTAPSTATEITSFDEAATNGAIVTTSFDGNARVWGPSGKLTATLPHGSPLRWAGFSHDGKLILTVGRGTTARLWSYEGKQLKEFQHADLINRAAFSADDQRIVTSSADGTAVIWSVQGDRLTVLQHKSEVYSAEFSPDGQLVATAAADPMVRVWKQSGSLDWEQPTGDTVQKLAFSSDGQHLLAVTTGKVAWVFQTASGLVVAQLKHPEDLIIGDIAPTRNFVLTSALDRVVRVWDFAGNRVAEFSHQEPVGSVVMSRDGKRVLTASDDGRARLWDLSGNELFVFPDEAKVQRAAFSVDGQKVLTLTPTSVRTWNFGSPESVIAHYAGSIAKPSRKMD